MSGNFDHWDCVVLTYTDTAGYHDIVASLLAPTAIAGGAALAIKRKKKEE